MWGELAGHKRSSAPVLKAGHPGVSHARIVFVCLYVWVSGSTGPNLLRLHRFGGNKVCTVLYAPVRGGSSTSNLIEPSLMTSSQREQGIQSPCTQVRRGSTGLMCLNLIELVHIAPCTSNADYGCVYLALFVRMSRFRTYLKTQCHTNQSLSPSPPLYCFRFSLKYCFL